MPLCKNTDKKRYTGNENTPLGKGYSASVEELGKRMKGTDGNMYKVVKTKGGKRWMKITSKVKSPRMYGADIGTMRSQYYPGSEEWEQDMAAIKASQEDSVLTEEEIKEIEQSVMREMREMEDTEAKNLSRKGLLDTSRFQGAPVHRFKPEVQEIIRIKNPRDIGAGTVRKKMNGNISEYIDELDKMRKETGEDLVIPSQYQYDDWGRIVEHLYYGDSDDTWNPRKMAQKTFFNHGVTWDKYNPDEGSVSYLTDGTVRRPAYKWVD